MVEQMESSTRQALMEVGSSSSGAALSLSYSCRLLWHVQLQPELLGSSSAGSDGGLEQASHTWLRSQLEDGAVSCTPYGSRSWLHCMKEEHTPEKMTPCLQAKVLHVGGGLCRDVGDSFPPPLHPPCLEDVSSLPRPAQIMPGLLQGAQDSVLSLRGIN